MRVSPEIVAGLCAARSRDLLKMELGDLAGLDPVKLLWGISGVESNFGLNSTPRHEQAYCYGGRYYAIEPTIEWGCLAHCSYGPWQVMFDNFPPTISPIGLLVQGDGSSAADASLQAAIGVLNHAISRGAKTLVDLVTAYNGPADVEFYARKLFACFERPMPQYQDRVIV
jgi:hypothetical protein